MARNILGIQPYTDCFFRVVEKSLRDVFNRNQDIQNIEIEIKYAQFKYIGASIDERALQDPSITPLLKRRITEVVQTSTNMLLGSIKTLSRQRILHLNPLGRGIYMLSAGFNEANYKKYYHIREFLIKMCEAYQGDNRHEVMSIYREMRMNTLDGNRFIMFDENDIRLDIHIKDLEDLGGRYSYSIKAAKWVKVKKEGLAEQADFMLNERTFRLAINKQIQTEVLPETIVRISQLLRAKPKLTDVRMKRLMRVKKGQICSYDMSEILNINEANKNIDPNFYASIVLPPEELNIYVKKQFINFYSIHEQNHIKFEIEAQFTPYLVGVLKRHIQENSFDHIKYQLERTIHELYALFFCDHTTKVRQIPWLNKKVALNNNTLHMPQARLENEYGNYMRSQLYETMNYYG